MTARIILLAVALLIVLGCGRGAAGPAMNYPVGTRFVVEVSGRAIEVEVIAVVMRDGTTWHVVSARAGDGGGDRSWNFPRRAGLARGGPVRRANQPGGAS